MVDVPHGSQLFGYLVDQTERDLVGAVKVDHFELLLRWLISRIYNISLKVVY